jgi:cytoskeletal protein CcmA (bactofilin family)
MPTVFKRLSGSAAGLMAGLGLAMTLFAPAALGHNSQTIAHGAGTTIIEGGTGSAGGFVPVFTTLAFHAEQDGGTVTGDFECFARVPASGTGTGSAAFTVNAMYVTGQITGAVVNGDSVTLTGTATITGLGAGTNVPFEIVVHKGGPGTTAVLTTGGLVFHEILVEGSIETFERKE